MATCIRPTALTAISRVGCPVNWGQFILALFQRAQDTPSFATEADMKSLAKWTPLVTATDGTKVIVTPEFPGFKIPGSEPQYAAENSNDSIGGQGYFTGFNAVKPTGKFVGIPSDVRSQLALVQDESLPGLDPGMTAYLVTLDGRILYTKNPDSGAISGIPFTNFYVGSTSSEGFKANNENAFGLTLDGEWDKNWQIVKPSFDPRTKLRA